MSLHLESCSVREMCESFGGSEILLNELREKLGDWLKLQPHLPQDVSKETLEHFILGTKMSLEQAKRKLDMFYTMKRLVPDILANRDPRGPGLTCMNTIMRTVYLPKLTPNKCRVFISQIIHDDYSKLNACDFVKYTLMIDELLRSESRNLGNIYLFDQSLMSLGFVAKFPPALMKKSEVTLTKAHARSVRGIHLINAVPLTDIIVNIMKKVLKTKLAARIHVHSRGSYESLHQHIPKSILPKDYGGEERSMAELAEYNFRHAPAPWHALKYFYGIIPYCRSSCDLSCKTVHDESHELWRRKVDENRDWFLEQDKIFVDERLRPGPAVDADDLFGFSGSFRQLDVD